MNKKWLGLLSALIHTHLTMTRPLFFTFFFIFYNIHVSWWKMVWIFLDYKRYHVVMKRYQHVDVAIGIGPFFLVAMGILFNLCLLTLDLIFFKCFVHALNPINSFQSYPNATMVSYKHCFIIHHTFSQTCLVIKTHVK
jgi:hypothetical protein